MKHNELIERLSNLKLEENNLKRILDVYYRDENMRTKAFNKIKKVKKEIEQIKFKLKLEKELKNENNNTNNT